MIEVALMVEGQNGLTWPRWQNIARAAEDLERLRSTWDVPGLGLIGIVSIVRDMNADGRRRYNADELWRELVRSEVKG